MKDIEYYIHIPFCKKKCRYCDFLSFSSSRDVMNEYIDRLCEEIKSFDEKGEFEIKTIFIGGGTPSLLPAGNIEKIMHAVTDYHAYDPDAEITIEGNPGTLEEEKLFRYRKAGINRLSMGVQSFLGDELRLLGRMHTPEDVYRNFENARKCGFDNINLDLMSALPGQSKEKWLESLKRAVDLGPEHISAYSLIIEEGTPFYDLYHEEEEKKEAGESTLLLPSEELEREMYYDTRQYLLQQGYDRYEISNYAKEARACCHNMGYWERCFYKGFGLGAASMIENVRFANTASMEEYLRGSTEGEKEKLTKEEQIEETMFLGLRMMKGVDREQFYRTYGKDMLFWYEKQISDLQEKGLAVLNEKSLSLTDKGVDLANYVCAQFLL